MKVCDILTPNPECVAPETPLTVAARRMKALNVGMLPICEKDRLIGMITDRDMIVRAVALGANPNTTPVREVMTPEVFYCYEDDDIQEAAELMERRQIRRLPVLSSEKRLVGIVSLGDLAVRTHREQLAGEVLQRVSLPDAEMIELEFKNT
jgi:CBS domain-containing protein